MAKESKPVFEKKSGAGADSEKKSGAQIHQGAGGNAPKKSGLSDRQKLALIGGTVVIALVLGIALFLLPSQEGGDVQAFSDFLYRAKGSGILMDIRGVPDKNVSGKIMQCGINLISGGFYQKAQKDLLVYSCDNSGCTESRQVYNSTNVTIVSNNQSIKFDEALYNLRGRAYFYIKYGADSKKTFYPNYLEVVMNETSDPSQCSVNIKTQGQ